MFYPYLSNYLSELQMHIIIELKNSGEECCFEEKVRTLAGFDSALPCLRIDYTVV